MASESASLFSIARNKLQSVVTSSRDSCSLHRWVLLKNSIIRDPQLSPPNPTPSPEADAHSVCRHEEETFEEVEQDYFSFPDPHSLHDEEPSSARNVENQWLDSLLEGLEDDDDDEHITVSSVSPHDDAEPLSPLYSPMSSSDDLADQSSYYQHYPMPYPPVSPPVIPSWFELHADSDPVSTPSSLPAPYDSPLPYFAVDELEDSPVPDAIEDTSDDESDTPSTPSVTSTSSLAHSTSPSSPSTPPQRTRFLSHPQVYVETDDSYFRFESDPLPFPDAPDVVRPTYPQEC